MKNTSFYFRFWHFVLGFFFGILGVLWSVFAMNERRDKIYSSILGFGINMLVTLYLLKNNLITVPDY
jgi:hypothetical protein